MLRILFHYQVIFKYVSTSFHTDFSLALFKRSIKVPLTTLAQPRILATLSTSSLVHFFDIEDGSRGSHNAFALPYSSAKTCHQKGNRLWADIVHLLIWECERTYATPADTTQHDANASRGHLNAKRRYGVELQRDAESSNYGYRGHESDRRVRFR